MIFLNINTQQLRYFMELAKCLNFTRAAANLYVAQPTLSQQIAELEAQLGVPLFIRNSRAVTLTPAGAILQAAYPDIAAQMEKLQQHMLITAAGFSGSLTIGYLDCFMDLMPRIMRAFNRTFPDVALKPVCGTRNELSAGLKNHTLDVVFSIIQDFAIEDLPAVSSRLTLRDPLCFVLPGDRDIRDDAFAASAPLIVFSESTDSYYQTHIKSLLGQQQLHIPKVIAADSISDLRAYLEAGMGYSVLPQSQASFFSADTRFVPIADAFLEFGILWDPGSVNPALPLFLDSLEQDEGAPAVLQ